MTLRSAADQRVILTLKLFGALLYHREKSFWPVDAEFQRKNPGFSSFSERFV